MPVTEIYFPSKLNRSVRSGIGIDHRTTVLEVLSLQVVPNAVSTRNKALQFHFTASTSLKRNVL